MPSQDEGIVEFLRARYTEAREQQHRIFRGTYRAGAPCPVCEQPTESMTQFVGDPSRLASFEPCRHVVNEPALLERFEEPAPDPDVLADLDAKLAILDEHPSDGSVCTTCAEEEDFDDDADGNRTWSRHGKWFPCPTLRHLAVPFAAHPDYDERWRP